MRKILQQAAELLFPSHCLVCGKLLAQSWEIGSDRHGICTDCFSQITFLHPPFCRVCGQAMVGLTADGLRCGKCHRFPPPYDLARSLVHYDSPVKDLIARLKYHEDTTVSTIIRHLAAHSDLHEFDDCDIFLPVPLHPRRLRQRGVNQSLELARWIFPERKGKILPNIFNKLINTPVQTSLDGAARRKNLRDSFAVSDEAQIRDRVVGLVDDVFTTGTTVAACARVLRKYKVKEIRVITLARV